MNKRILENLLNLPVHLQEVFCTAYNNNGVSENSLYFLNEKYNNILTELLDIKFICGELNNIINLLKLKIHSLCHNVNRENFYIFEIGKISSQITFTFKDLQFIININDNPKDKFILLICIYAIVEDLKFNGEMK